jgi:hypothetical protein
MYSGQTDATRGAKMADFHALLKDPSGLCQALEAIQIEGKLRADLQRLFDSAEGLPCTRDAEQRLSGDTVRTCATLGARLSKHLNMKEPADKMLWLGSVKRDATGHERWVMRAEVRLVLKRLGWFGPGPQTAASPASLRVRRSR